MGACTVFSMICSSSALKFVSYPLQALVKSAKIMSIMIVSLVLGGKRRQPKEYLVASLITIGIVMFNLSDSKKKI